MPSTPSLLRYPGGKSSVFPLVSEIIKKNSLEGCVYAEPYAGGAGLALNLLLKGIVSDIVLNDFDKSVWQFWELVLDQPEDLIKKIENVDVTIEQWFNQKHIQANPSENSPLDLGFSTLFLNRTNRSGIIKGGVIGGIEQLGNYKLDCRFGKSGLIKKIEKIQKYRCKIRLYNLDAIDFFNETDRLLANKGFYCIDPPYYKKGRTLYTNFYEHKDHEILSKRISLLETKWILTYDNTPQIRNLYSDYQQYLFDLNYSAGTKRKGTELMICSTGLKIHLEQCPHTV